MTGGWRKLHHEEIHNLYSLHNIIRMIKLRRMISAGHVARMEEIKIQIEFWFGSLERRPRFRWEVNIKVYVLGKK
jgi:hypothetical protein